MSRAITIGLLANLALISVSYAEGFISYNYLNLEEVRTRPCCDTNTRSNDIHAVNLRYLRREEKASMLFDLGYGRNDEERDWWHLGGHMLTRVDAAQVGAFFGYAGNARGGVATVALEATQMIGEFSIAPAVSFGFDTHNDAMWSLGTTIKYFLNDDFSVSVSAEGVQDTSLSKPLRFNTGGYALQLEVEHQLPGTSVSAFASYRETDIDERATEVLGFGLRWNIGQGTLSEREQDGLRLKRPRGLEHYFIHSID